MGAKLKRFISCLLLLLFSLLHTQKSFSYTLYSLTRFFADIKKEDDFEDIFELKQRLFLEYRHDLADGSIFFDLSGKFEIDYFVGGFSRLSSSFDLFELYLGLSYENLNFSLGRKIVAWGTVDSSPLDVINRPNFSEGFFNEPKFLKVPSLILQGLWVFGDSSVDLVYEPFFNPPIFYDVGNDWAILNWNVLNDSFDGDKENAQLKNILSGLVSPVVKNYPEKLTEVLMSFGVGFQFKTSLDNLNLSFVSYTGSSFFPVPFFEQTFVNYFERSPRPISEKLEISALEIVEPASRGEAFVEFKPTRYYVVGSGWSYDIDGYLVKNDLAMYLLADLPDENMRIREFNILSWAFDVEREIIPNLFVIPSFRGVVDLSPQRKIMLIENGVFLPALNGRYEFFIGNSSFSFLGSFVLDVPFELDIRSYFIILSATWKPKDVIEISSFSYILGGEKVSLFGFLKNNSAISLWLKLYF